MHIIGNDVARYAHLRVWAERGLVHIEDARDNSYECVPYRTMLERINAINEMLGKSRLDRGKFIDEDLRNRLQTAVEEIFAVCKKAKEQGSPDDPAARREASRRASATVRMPSAAASF